MLFWCTRLVVDLRPEGLLRVDMCTKCTHSVFNNVTYILLLPCFPQGKKWNFRPASSTLGQTAKDFAVKLAMCARISLRLSGFIDCEPPNRGEDVDAEDHYANLGISEDNPPRLTMPHGEIASRLPHLQNPDVQKMHTFQCIQWAFPGMKTSLFKTMQGEFAAAVHASASASKSESDCAR